MDPGKQAFWGGLGAELSGASPPESRHAAFLVSHRQKCPPLSMPM
jgi:hypothetical protein